MLNFLWITFFIIGCLLSIFIIWRLLSHCMSIPCPSWLGWMVEVDNPFSKINRAATIIEYLDLKPGMTILDAGCGPGRLTIPIAQKVGPNGKVVALDIQEKMLKRVQKKVQAVDLNNVTYLNMALGSGQLESNIYDRVILVTVIGEIPDKKVALQEIFNALKPGGILSVTEIILDPHYQRLNTVLNLAQEIGFRKKKVYSDWVAYNLLLEKPT